MGRYILIPSQFLLSLYVHFIRYKNNVNIETIFLSILILFLFGMAFTLGHSISIGPSLENIQPENRFRSGMYGFGFALFDMYMSCFFCLALMVTQANRFLRGDLIGNKSNDIPLQLILLPLLFLVWSVTSIVIHPFQWFWWNIVNSIVFLGFAVWIISAGVTKSSDYTRRIAFLGIGMLGSLSLIIRATDSMNIATPDQEPLLSDFLSRWGSRNATLWSHSLFYSSVLSLAIITVVSVFARIQRYREKSANKRFQGTSNRAVARPAAPEA